MNCCNVNAQAGTIVAANAVTQQAHAGAATAAAAAVTLEQLLALEAQLKAAPTPCSGTGGSGGCGNSNSSSGGGGALFSGTATSSLFGFATHAAWLLGIVGVALTAAPAAWVLLHPLMLAIYRALKRIALRPAHALIRAAAALVPAIPCAWFAIAFYLVWAAASQPPAAAPFVALTGHVLALAVLAHHEICEQLIEVCKGQVVGVGQASGAQADCRADGGGEWLGLWA